MDTGKTKKIEVITPQKKEETVYVPNPMSPSRIREIEKEITRTPERVQEPEKVK